MNRFFLLLAFTWFTPLSLFASAVSARLVAESDGVIPGKPITLALVLDHPEPWHTYWINPGTSGIPTTLDLTLPAGFTSTSLQWPAPSYYEFVGEPFFGYGGRVVALLEVQTPALITETEITLRGRAEWLECDDEQCVPGSMRVSVRLSVREAVQPDPAQVELFNEARQRMPRTVEGWSFSLVNENGHALIVRAPENVESLDGARFFPAQPGVFDPKMPMAWEKTPDGFRLPLPKEFPTVEVPDLIEGVLVPAGSEKSFSVLVRAASVSKTSDNKKGPAAAAAEGGLLLNLLIGFLGGLILNLMPCVFPVISLKIMGFVNQAHGDRRLVMRHGWVYAGGVIASFLVMAGVILALRAGGSQVGWAAQMQEPGVVIGIGLLLTLISLNLFGVFEVAQRLTGVGGELQSKEGYSGSFFTGVLAVVIGAPCSGPMMAPAVGWAFTQPAISALLIFLALGVGMALPYVLLSAKPQWLDRLPRPGPWMETFKQSMGFIMLFAVLYFVWVLSTQLGGAAVVWMLLGMLIVSMAAWVYGRWCGFERSNKTRRISIAIAASLFAAGCWTAYRFDPPAGAEAIDEVTLAGLVAKGYTTHDNWTPDARAKLETSGVRLLWTPFDPEAVTQWVANDEPVFIDFTASWCLICQANKKTTLRRDETEALFASRTVRTVTADFTNKDARIFEAMEALGRSAVPVYVLYPGRNKPPVLLPSTLTPDIVRTALDEAGVK